jgi:hypothetical protein
MIATLKLGISGQCYKHKNEYTTLKSSFVGALVQEHPMRFEEVRCK